MGGINSQLSSRIMGDLQRDFGLTPAQAAGVVGNLAHESGNFKSMQEISPTVKGSRGGYGWAQWTGSRRMQFEAYAKAKNLDIKSYAANYGFLAKELRTTEKAALAAIKATRTVQAAALATETKFERPGVSHRTSRQKYAKQAFSTYTPAAYDPNRHTPADELGVPASRIDGVTGIAGPFDPFGMAVQAAVTRDRPGALQGALPAIDQEFQAARTGTPSFTARPGVATPLGDLQAPPQAIDQEFQSARTGVPGFAANPNVGTYSGGVPSHAIENSVFDSVRGADTPSYGVGAAGNATSRGAAVAPAPAFDTSRFDLGPVAPAPAFDASRFDLGPAAPAPSFNHIGRSAPSVYSAITHAPIDPVDVPPAPSYPTVAPAMPAATVAPPSAQLTRAEMKGPAPAALAIDPVNPYGKTPAERAVRTVAQVVKGVTDMTQFTSPAGIAKAAVKGTFGPNLGFGKGGMFNRSFDASHQALGLDAVKGYADKAITPGSMKSHTTPSGNHQFSGMSSNFPGMQSVTNEKGVTTVSDDNHSFIDNTIGATNDKAADVSVASKGALAGLGGSSTGKGVFGDIADALGLGAASAGTKSAGTKSGGYASTGSVRGDDGSNANGGDPKVLCGHYARKGWLDAETYAADLEYAATVDVDTVRGYHRWAVPLVKIIETHPVLEKIIWPFVKIWASSMKRRSTLWSKVLRFTGEGVCRMLAHRNSAALPVKGTEHEL